MSRSPKEELIKIVNHDAVVRGRYTYHAHEAGEVVAVVGSSLGGGLSDREVARRQEADGPNHFTEAPQPAMASRVLNQLKSPLALVLVAAFLLTLALGEYIDAAVICFALALAVGVGLLQEGRASRAFATLARSQSHPATVLRNGKRQEVLSETLVVGDIVYLEQGSRVPADLRILDAKALTVNEAVITGESRPVAKAVAPVPQGAPVALRSSMVYQGTFVVDGVAVGVVVAIGDETEMGRVAAAVQTVRDEQTPLQVEMHVLSQKLLVVIALLVIMIFVVGLVTGQPLGAMLLMAIAVAVASVPEGLPAAVTIVLAVGMEALLRSGGLVRNLLAAETLGSTTYVLTDKTGTLTTGEMTITGFMVADGEVVRSEDFLHYPDTHRAFELALAASNAYKEAVLSTPVLRGHAEERAVLAVAESLGITEAGGSYRARRIDFLPFTSVQRFAAGLVPGVEGAVLAVNGAPFVLLHSATHYYEAGRELPLTSAMRETLRQSIDTAAAAGRRLIAVGYKHVSYHRIPEQQKTLLEGLCLVGFLVIEDPVREGVRESIAGVMAAGARVVLITGDNPETALTVARSVGIAEADSVALSGHDLEMLTDEELRVALAEVSVFARVLPEQKLRIASVLSQAGEVVAMTGDGVNDAPALRRAHIGIALGSGTEVAKEASDLILMNNSFAIIYAAIEEGRRIVANIRKIVAYLLATSLSEVFLITIALVTAGPLPLLPAQILWGNIIEEGLMSVAFAFERGEKGAMRRRPRDVHEEGLVSRSMFGFMLIAVLVLGVLNVLLYLFVRSLGVADHVLQSVMFLSIAMDSLFIAFSFRSLSVPVWHISLRGNWFFFASFALSAGLLFIALSVPFMREVLSYTPLPAQFIALPVITSFIGLVVVECAKWFFFMREEKSR